MPLYKALRNARIGKERYLKGTVVELDPKVLVGKEDNFEACDAPVSKPAKEAKAPKEKKSAEVKALDPEPVEPLKPKADVFFK